MLRGLAVSLVVVMGSASGVSAESPPGAAPSACVLEGTFAIEWAPGEPPDAGMAPRAGWLRLALPALPAACIPPSQAVLEVIVVPPAQITVDALAVGKVGVTRVPLSEGFHTVLVAHPEYRPLRRRVALIPGQTQRVVIDLAEEGMPRRSAPR